MILDTLENAVGYTELHPNFSDAFGFLSQNGLENLAAGKYEVSGNVYAIIDHVNGRRVDEGELEAHQRYIDIQYVISGEESMGWHNRLGLENSKVYDAEKDLEFFHGEPASIIRVPPGSFAIFYPDDAHLPLIGDGAIHKVVVKVDVTG